MTQGFDCGKKQTFKSLTVSSEAQHLSIVHVYLLISRFLDYFPRRTSDLQTKCQPIPLTAFPWKNNCWKLILKLRMVLQMDLLLTCVCDSRVLAANALPRHILLRGFFSTKGIDVLTPTGYLILPAYHGDQWWHLNPNAKLSSLPPPRPPSNVWIDHISRLWYLNWEQIVTSFYSPASCLDVFSSFLFYFFLIQAVKKTNRQHVWVSFSSSVFSSCNCKCNFDCFAQNFSSK